MTCLGRHVSAALVVIAMIAAQIMPAWAGCHAMKHAVTATIMVHAAGEASPHHGQSHVEVFQTKAALTAADQSLPSSADLCLGNCGCACGVSGAFVLAGIIAVGEPHGVALDPEFTSSALPLGNRPDGLRRPPRPTA